MIELFGFCGTALAVQHRSSGLGSGRRHGFNDDGARFIDPSLLFAENPFSGSSGLLDDERPRVITTLLVELVVGSIAERKLP
jgi:hypothetical protein